MLTVVITLGVLCVLFLVALIVVSIELGICKTRTNIPAVIMRNLALYSPGGLAMKLSKDEVAKANLATLDQVKAAPNLSQPSLAGNPIATYWIKGSMLVDVDAKGRVTKNTSDPKGSGSYYGLVVVM